MKHRLKYEGLSFGAALFIAIVAIQIFTHLSSASPLPSFDLGTTPIIHDCVAEMASLQVFNF